MFAETKLIKMKGLNKKQIKQVRETTYWQIASVHGNRKYIGALTVQQFGEIARKKWDRMILKNKSYHALTQMEEVMYLLKWSAKCRGTGYYKILIEGNTGVYYASPVYGHSDYNKHRLFDKTEKTLKIMRLFNTVLLHSAAFNAK